MKDKVAYLGPEDVTFGYMAGEKFFSGRDVEFVSFTSHAKVAEAVGMGITAYGIVAIENVISGVIPETARAVDDMDAKYGVKICGEVELPIQLFYLRKDPALSTPEKILSHSSPIDQCRRFVNEMQKEGVTFEIRGSTGQVAKEASENPNFGVLASSKAEEVFGLKRVKSDSVTDTKNNFTRFWVLSKQHYLNQERRPSKTCFLLNLIQSQPGALQKSLDTFASCGINLLIIYPIPIPGKKWEYTFMIEFSGHINDQLMSDAWDTLIGLGIIVGHPHFLGSYVVAT